MSDLNDLQQKVIKFRDARDWKQFHNPKDIAISLNLEAAELLEHFQWKNNNEVTDYLKTAKGREIEKEIAEKKPQYLKTKKEARQASFFVFMPRISTRS